MSTRARREGGYSLVAVMVSVVILLVGLLSLARMQTLLLGSQTGSANRQAAVTIARSYLEQVRGRDPHTLASEAEVRVNAAGQPAAAGGFGRRLEVVEQSPSLVRVRVLVTYPRGPAPIELVTLAYRRNV